MSKENTIKQCVLIGQSLGSDYQNSSVFNKIGLSPVIQICITWLVDNGIKQIYIFYSKSKHQMEQYYQQYMKYSKSQVKIYLNFMKTQQLKNFGDVMRQVQFRNIITEEFMVLYADTIANFNVGKVMESYNKKKVEVRNVVLTSVLKDQSYDKKIHIMNSQTSQILQIDEDADKKFTLNKQKINLKRLNIQFRRDITHCQIYICSVQVLKYFKQNYQYTNMLDFINGMLTSEVFDQKIIGYVLTNHESSYRINRAKDYYLAYVNYICGHFYPYLLTKGKGSKGEDYRFVSRNFNKIIFNGVVIPRTTYISNNCYIGQKSIIGSNTSIQKSIIGDRCQIGPNVSLKNCIILSGCNIKQKSIYENSLIQKINQFQQIKLFTLFPKYQMEIVTEPVFEETPPPQENTFQEELQQVVGEEPRMEIVNQLNSIRKHHNKSLQYFLKQMIRLISPSGEEGVSQFAQKWGPIILKIHQNPKLLLDSLYYSCQNIQMYDKAFHVFIQYLYKQDILKNFVIQQWFEEMVNKYEESPMLQKCQNFISYLKKQEEEGQDEEQQNEDEDEQNN